MLPVRPSALLFHGNQQQAAGSAAAQTCEPAQPSQRFSAAPCPYRNVRSGCWLSSQGGQGIVGIRCGRRINTHTFALVVSRPSLLLHTLLISTVFVALVSTQTDCIDQISLVQFCSVPISLASDPSHSAPPALAPVSAPSSCRPPRICPLARIVTTIGTHDPDSN